MKQTTITDYFKPTIIDDVEVLCSAAAVMESMVDRLYYAENNLESNIKKVLEERDKVEEFENISINYFKENGKLPEWYIRYKLGKKLILGYNLIHIEDEKYEEEKNYSVGYDLERRWRFQRNLQDRDTEAEEYLKNTFNNYFFNKEVCLYSSKGHVSFKIVDEGTSWNIYCNDPWSSDYGWISDNGGLTTTEIINRILSEIHKHVFILVGYKKKNERRLIGEFKNGKPKYKNFMIDDLTKPIYKFA